MRADELEKSGRHLASLNLARLPIASARRRHLLESWARGYRSPMMARSATLVCLAGLIVSACAYGPPVKTPEAAIALADKACYQGWGRHQGGLRDWANLHNEWHARLVGDDWKIWTGEEASPGYSISIASDGRRPNGPNECKLTFPD
jgi:hypothetical protein